ncbi:glycosyltransferase [Acinetobacter sp. ANC 4862]|uniref:glycosyltransferase family 8 protein n=1 Tax=Acinetobacter sp. ANC 4862 TaxID=2529849 RepID=UPI001039251C|nr:glycosyltransferase [Acinetobacter sp. ANC 4862]TCH64447.1 glycosyl transferase family 8 [Acinetobacter sp. ANC 4862]
MSYSKNLVNEAFELSNQVTNFTPDINIVFAIDKNYLKPCGICIHSIIKNNPHTKIDFYIFTSYFESMGFEEFIKNNKNIRIHIYKINTNYFDHLQTTGHFTTAIYYRLSIAEILKNKVEKFLYLDADILCTASIDEILSINMNNYILAAVEDKFMKSEDIKNLGLNSNNKYFNSGVLLINTKAWIEFNVVEKFTKLISERIYEYPDQDVLNIILQNKVYFLNEKFNFFTKNKEVDPIFIHFVSTPKPWSIAASNNEKYIEYYLDSPWKNIPLNAPRNSKEAKKYAKKLWSKKSYLSSIRWLLIYIVRKFS